MLAISVVFIILYGGLFYYYLRGWNLARVESEKKIAANRMISVIIPARNEEKNILRLLDALKEQSYPPAFFEIIVVDDFSTDDTAGVVNSSGLQNLRCIQPAVGTEQSSKKKAIEAGIANAEGELIVTTDADCIPAREWLQTIHQFYIETSAEFIAAPVKFTHDKSLLQTFQAIDFLTLQGITAASVTSGSLSMCNGANLAYTKKAFNEVNGFEGIDHVATGDDMLLMHKIWKKHPSNVHYLKNKNAIVRTEPMATWKEFFMQRKRWASKTLVYDDRRIIAVLVFVYLFNCLFFLLVAFAIVNPLYWWYVVGFWIAKALVEFPFVKRVAGFYGEEKLLTSFFFLQPLHIFYTVFVGLLSQFGKYEWKGRRTK
ncbi:MAG: glycosyltransferase [Flavisolibacter sp.]